MTKNNLELVIIQSSQSLIDQLTKMRPLELKLGETIGYTTADISDLADLSMTLLSRPEKYVLMGISEDVGIRANYGQPGAKDAYQTCMEYFLNFQSNQYVLSQHLFILGQIYVEDIQEKSLNADIDTLRKLTAQIDHRVSPVIEMIVKANKIPIVIGGGHNNAYGIIKGASHGLGIPIDVFNIDPHLDCRPLEGRHSGNPFSYAFRDKYLKRYQAWGIQEMYNSQASFEHVSKYGEYVSFDRIKWKNPILIKDFLDRSDSLIGIEIDLDCIKDMDASAMTPVGFTEEEIITYIHTIKSVKQPIYYHLAEGKPDANAPYKVGKFLAYVVAKIIK